MDDRVEGAIESINEERDAMTNAATGSRTRRRGNARGQRPIRRRSCSGFRRRTPRTLAVWRRMRWPRRCRPRHSKPPTKRSRSTATRGRFPAELAHAKRTQGDSMQMAMELSSTFEALVPYFVYRTVLEQDLGRSGRGLRTREAGGRAATVQCRDGDPRDDLPRDHARQGGAQAASDRRAA